MEKLLHGDGLGPQQAGLLAAFSLLALVTFSKYSVFRGKTDVPYPPGPKPRFFWGNALDIPTVKPWVKYSEWSRQFNSDILHMTALGTHIIVLQNRGDAIALLEKRSSQYSNRPFVPIFDLLDMKENTVVIQYGEMWRQQRRILQHHFKAGAISQYQSVQLEKVHGLLYNLLNTPENFYSHCKKAVAAISLAVTYGHEMGTDENDYLYRVAELTAKAAEELSMPGRTLINLLPFLKYIPSWFPGATIQREAADVRKVADVYKNRPYDSLKKDLATGIANPCMLSKILEQQEKLGNMAVEERVVKEAIATVYLAGAETTADVTLMFLMAMALHPDVAKKAQKELDRVVGLERLPTLEDREALPYLEAIIREVLRWNPVTPLAFPHSVTQDDVYKGYRIPKGAIIFPNVWAMMHDESRYKDPGKFIPERFFQDDGTLNDDRVDIIFGFGRRCGLSEGQPHVRRSHMPSVSSLHSQCLGQHFGLSTLWIIVASVLACFDISPAKDEEGKDIPIDKNNITSGIVCHILPFKCSIKPRSRRAAELILSLHEDTKSAR
ncbi:hypothetical protein AMATHDRAFT_81734 [Amanita thiersii Skay4041]|uniref:Cytochrome P450 n=1 Tax=Amanita thiersii Skay4041 TaxID=703135 RepID=A0A2A9NLG2_9AGAR|nr:hypothetical protein AMATHDRAFT_81734 [Amanita thiersii Skay4041]